MAAIILVGGLHPLAQSPLDVVSVRENPTSGPNSTTSIVFRPGRLRGAEYLPGRPLSFHGSGSIDRLAEDLALQSHHLVVNETGLQGFFVWDIVYRAGLGDANRIETAFHEELGIKLESKRLPANVVVIDDVRMPTPN